MAEKNKSASAQVGIDGGEDVAGVSGRLSKMVKRGRLVCADGLSVSAQANEFSYCSPRENDGPYESVELGYPSREIQRWADWAEDPGALTGTVYSRVPVGVVAYVIAECGGRDPGQCDWSAHDMAGGALVAQSPLASSKRIDMDAPLKEWSSACARWIQEAVLGSPQAEGTARFEVWRGQEMLLDWGRCLGCFVGAGLEDAQQNDFTGWVRGMREIAHLEIASKSGQKAPRRRFL